MGLLDEAIREHLDLKRRRGADPSEVEREEQAALGLAGEDSPSSVESGTEEPVGVASPAVDEADPRARAEALYASQETVEIDMQTLLGIGSEEHAGEAAGMGWEQHDAVFRAAGPQRRVSAP
jgi:hypothetical protein